MSLFTHQRCGWWPQTEQSSWLWHCPSPSSWPRPVNREIRWNERVKMIKQKNKMWALVTDVRACVYLIYLVCSRVFANSDSERSFIGHGYSQLHVWHAVIVLSHEKESESRTGAKNTNKCVCIYVLSFFFLPHLIPTGTPAWCHFLQLPVQSTLQNTTHITLG